MAPELVKGSKYSLKADVWSLGILLYQIIMNRKPFSGKNMEALQKNQEVGKWKLPSNISTKCGDFLTKCLKYQSEKRADFQELLNHPFLMEDDEFLNRIGYDPTKYRMSMEMNINVSQNVIKHQESELMKAIRFNIEQRKAE